MAALTLEVSRREIFGSTAVGRLRRAGKVPAILYGMGKESVPLTADAAQIDTLLKSAGGQNAIFDLSLEGTDMRRSVMIKDLQRLLTTHLSTGACVGCRMPVMVRPQKIFRFAFSHV